jgi:hypothetical protein
MHIVVCICTTVDIALQNAVYLNKRLHRLGTGYGFAQVKEASKGYGFVVYMPEASFKALGYEQRSDLSEFI